MQFQPTAALPVAPAAVGAVLVAAVRYTLMVFRVRRSCFPCKLRMTDGPTVGPTDEPIIDRWIYGQTETPF